MDDLVSSLGEPCERLPERLFGDGSVARQQCVFAESTAFEVERLWRLLAFEEWRQRLLDNDFARHLRDDDGKLMSKLVLAIRDEV
jgi:hypothetical protein